VIHEHAEPWWNDIDREKFSIRPHSSLAFVPAESSSSKAEESGEGNYEFCQAKNLFHTPHGFLKCIKVLRHWANGFTSPPKKDVLQIS
jgi:hypothetical protein